MLAMRPENEPRSAHPTVAVVHGLVRGGARRRLEEQVEHLGLAVREFCPSTATALTSSAAITNCPVLAPRFAEPLRPPLRYLDLLRLAAAWRGISRAVTRSAPDVVFMNPCLTLQTPPLTIRSDVPVIYFCDEPRRVDYEPEAAVTRRKSTRYLYGPLHAAERMLDRKGVRRADVILTNSRYTAVQIERAYGRVARPIPLGVPSRLLNVEPTSHEARGEKEYVLSVGALLEGKGHDLAIRAAAMATTPSSVVVVTPRPDPAAADALRRLAASLDVGLRIVVGISDDELAQVYVDALALVYLAVREPYGLASIEAQACGCPAIVASQGGLPETVIDGVTGLVVDRAAAAAAAAIEEVAGDRQRFSLAAREHGRKFTWEASAAVVRSVIDETLRSYRPNSAGSGAGAKEELSGER
jgi:glycosyltransferase involved in cell wall biosynthesis